MPDAASVLAAVFSGKTMTATKGWPQP
jgi:hypothetical protein